jgi:hypothetical protein
LAASLAEATFRNIDILVVSFVTVEPSQGVLKCFPSWVTSIGGTNRVQLPAQGTACADIAVEISTTPTTNQVQANTQKSKNGSDYERQYSTPPAISNVGQGPNGVIS